MAQKSEHHLDTEESITARKQEIRADMIQRRKAQSPADISASSRKLSELLFKQPCFIEAEYIYAYIDCKGEVSTKYIIEEAWRQHKQVAVPKVEGKNLQFYQLLEYGQLEEGFCHIPEPAKGKAVAWEKALMIMPGVAFDASKHRVGYGGGFYDRYLERHTQHAVLAIAFDYQIVPEFEVQVTDIMPDFVLTETTVYR
ncbi:MAG: 5-formyltetrahydrofolate cyclo-ligase [Lachnospiraceae bacterium]